MRSLRIRITSRRRAKGDDGAILVFLALSMSVLLVIAALVLDGGSGYVQRRQMQNAADAAAMAGARALDRFRFPPSGTTPDYTTIATQVNTVATNNGATTVVSCRLINFTEVNSAVDLGPCTSSVAAALAEGVRVTVSQTRTTYFGGITGRSTVTATTNAAALIQQLGTVTAPFVICGNAALGGYNLLNADGSLNPTNAANAGEMTIHGSQVPDCGAGSQFKGLIANPTPINQWTDMGINGNKVGQYTDVTNGITPCPSAGPYDNCDMVLPIMQQGSGNGSNASAFVTAFAIFHVTLGHTGNSAHTAHYVASVTLVAGGQGVRLGSGSAQLRLIKLVE
jgi:Flp pilus assembly protein TadG